MNIRKKITVKVTFPTLFNHDWKIISKACLRIRNPFFMMCEPINNSTFGWLCSWDGLMCSKGVRGQKFDNTFGLLLAKDFSEHPTQPNYLLLKGLSLHGPEAKWSLFLMKLIVEQLEISKSNFCFVEQILKYNVLQCKLMSSYFKTDVQ